MLYLIKFWRAALFIFIWGLIMAITPPVYAQPCTMTFGELDWGYEELHKSFEQYIQEKQSASERYVYPALVFAFLTLTGYTVFRLARARSDKELADMLFPEPYTIKPPSGLKRDASQRRMWVRVPVRTVIYLSILDEAHPEKETKFEKVVALDLSGGGFKISPNFELRPDQHVKVLLQIPGGQALLAKGKVVHVTPVPGQDKPHVGVQFIDITEQDRNRIVQWVFDYQRHLIVQQKRKEEGLCIICGKPLSEELISSGQIYCLRCQVYNRTREDAVPPLNNQP